MLNTELSKHLVDEKEEVRSCLMKLTDLRADAILFVCTAEGVLIGSLTDGDLRRGFIAGLGFDSPLLDFLQPNPIFIYKNQLHQADLVTLKKRNFLIIPIVDEQKRIVQILNLRVQDAQLPIDAIIMAGGRGERLLPLTKTTPKPLLPVGDKPILEHNIDQLKKVGIQNVFLSVNYLGEQVKEYFGDGSKKQLSISYINEDKPLGTIGSLKLTHAFQNDYLLIINCDVLTNIDYDLFFKTFLTSGADMAVATTHFQVQIPYGIFEMDEHNFIHGVKEKPLFTYQLNAGIYLVKKELLHEIPYDKHYHVTDLIEQLLRKNKRLIAFPILGFWMDIGTHADYKKANEIIGKIKW
jgi:dTDP-glucose pyrophosphorylase